MAERVKGSSLDQRLDYPLRAGLGADPGQEVLEGAEAFLFPRLDDALNYVLSNVSYRAETKPDVVPHRSKGPNRLIHIRRQNLDTHLPALIQVDTKLVFRVANAGEQCCHELCGVVGLEVGGPVAQDSIAG